MAVTVDPPFYKVGISREGDFHATRDYWGSGLCDAPLQSVDDRHNYTSGQLAALITCASCSAVAADALAART